MKKTIRKYEMAPEAREHPTTLSQTSSDLPWSQMDRPSLHREYLELFAFLTRVAEQAPVLIQDKPVHLESLYFTSMGMRRTTIPGGAGTVISKRPSE
jgi:hypothetical protein